MGRLTGKYAIVGVGETEYSHSSGRTTRAMAGEAVKKAMLDAGLAPKDVDGMMSYHSGDSITSPEVAADLGIRLNYFMNWDGGGSSTEALVSIAIGLMEARCCHTMVIYRSMNGYSQRRAGWTGLRAAAPVVGRDVLTRNYGSQTPAQSFAIFAMEHMKRYGTTSSQLAQVKVVGSKHASNNPKALYKKRVTVEDVLNSRWVVKPFHLLDCCVETDGAAAIVITSAERARTLRRPPVYVLGVAGRVAKPRSDWEYAIGPLSTVAQFYATKIAFGMAGITHRDVNLTHSYDCFTWCSLVQLEDAGYCKKGEGGDYVTSGIIELGGARPNNTSGGHLCEAYTNGIQHVIENVRQLRWQADDSCPGWEQGIHTYDYSEGKCRQVKEPYLGHNLGWGRPGYQSSMVLGRIPKP